MKSLLSILLVLVVACGGSASAKNKKSKPEQPKSTITQVNVLAITVSIGKDGNLHETYKITSATKVTIDESPANARDLRAGMVAAIEVADDKTTALSISASDPKADKRKKR